MENHNSCQSIKHCKHCLNFSNTGREHWNPLQTQNPETSGFTNHFLSCLQFLLDFKSTSRERFMLWYFPQSHWLYENKGNFWATTDFYTQTHTKKMFQNVWVWIRLKKFQVIYSTNNKRFKSLGFTAYKGKIWILHPVIIPICFMFWTWNILAPH